MAEWRINRTIRIPGVEHTGWLPVGASTPAPTEPRTVEIWIVHEPDGYFLYTNDGPYTFDSWHQSLEDAFAQAEYQYGVKPEEWCQVSE